MGETMMMLLLLFCGEPEFYMNANVQEEVLQNP